MPKVLLVGESWTSLGLHLKGFSLYTTGSYDEGGASLIAALEQSGWDVSYIPNHLVPSNFPSDLTALSAFDCVILSDVGADTFLLAPETISRSRVRANPLSLVAEYVALGGGLLMIGGFMSFSGIGGSACYHNTVLAEVLPVRMLGHDDRIERPEGVTPTVSVHHEILAGIPSQWPHFLGYQRLVAKQEAQTLLSVASDPFLVLGSYGEGRASAFASDCSPHWGPAEFVE